jgi:hypothetical protein
MSPYPKLTGPDESAQCSRSSGQVPEGAPQREPDRRAPRQAALENFDLNMAFFAQIPQADFEDALTEMLAKNKRLRPVTDLKSLDEEWGVYVLVLDEYRQAYIGQSSWYMRKRIKKHWNGTKQFDRLLWGGVEESVMSIDSFRALDTTRIFAARINYDALESRLVRSFPPDYLLNRIGGGAVTGMRSMFIGAEMKRRRLVADPGMPDSYRSGQEDRRHALFRVRRIRGDSQGFRH